ncbi:MAG TPA: molybdopterin-dependent oxidoreductase, partial [Dehalococcoidia bacterium]
VILRSLHRHGGGLWLVPSLALLAVVLGTLISGIGWSTVGRPSFGPYSGMTVHTVLGGALLLFLLVHLPGRWPGLRRGDLLGRRAFLRSGLLLAGGALAWRASEAVTSVAGWSGAGRRFTGSREVRGGGAQDFPESNWLTDDPAPLDLARWRLSVRGHVQQPLLRSLAQIEAAARRRAVLDCTGGWYVERTWQGVPLADLLAEAGVRAGARSVVVRSATGCWRRFDRHAARGALLATAVDGEPLTHGHGAPLRLIVPGRRGYEWVKWVTEVEVSTAFWWLKWPLPIS